ncbi:MAG: prepilin-type N-terminal cleavage/methylation domain-containing protein [Patescibacteria group bacterium]
MKDSKVNNKGFTIVELLIVVVIIGILAALVIIAYNGIQDRANNQKTESAVNAYRKALIQYATINGAYPTTANACLGEPFYTNCYTGSNNVAFNNAIRSFMGNAGQLPQPSTNQYTYGASTRAGAAFNYLGTATLDGSVHPWGISYILKGTGQCKLNGVAGNPPTLNWPNFSTTPNASGHTESQSSNSFCRLILPDPAAL